MAQPGGVGSIPPGSSIRQEPDAAGGQSEAADNSAGPQGDEDSKEDQSPQEIADEVGQGLIKLQQLVSQSQSVKPEEIQMLNSALQAYQQFYQSMSSDDSSSQNQPTPDQGNVPMEAGNAKVQPAM